MTTDEREAVERDEWVLKTSSLDDEEAERTFPTKDEAIDFAVVWFVSPYNPETNETIDSIPSGLAEDVAQLIADLRDGREFYCGRFYERATLLRLAEQGASRTVEQKTRA